MLLKHNIPICDFQNSVAYTDDVFKQIVKNITPPKIYVDNKEFLEAFAETLVNYSPISINIIDYWKKEVDDIGVIVPFKKDNYSIVIMEPFEFKEQVYNGEIIYKDIFGKGFSEKRQENGFEVGGHLLDKSKNIWTLKKNNDPYLCEDETDFRFYINSIIGVQDKLALTFLSDFYYAAENTKNDYLLRKELIQDLENYKLDTSLFNNINLLFDSQRTFAHKEFTAKKGTPASLKYVGQVAHDSQIQGIDNIFQDYFMDIIETGPFTYEVESTLFESIFERFIKPLAHPIGMGYEYKLVCSSEYANTSDYPLMELQYRLQNKNKVISVVCRCIDNKYTPDKDDVICSKTEDPLTEVVIGTYDGYDLWEEISEDEGGNIPKYYETGVWSDVASKFKGYYYHKYTFENKNFLISFITSDDEGVYEIYIQYHRYDSLTDTYTLIHQWDPKYHCSIKAEGIFKKVPKIEEIFETSCEKTENGIFQFLAENETPHNNQPDDDGQWSGFLGSSQNGGHLIRVGLR